MVRNMGTVDRSIRVLLALGIAALYFTGRISGPLAIVLGFFAIAFVLSSLVAWCPSYALFRISTRGRSGDPPSGNRPTT